VAIPSNHNGALPTNAYAPGRDPVDWRRFSTKSGKSSISARPIISGAVKKETSLSNVAFQPLATAFNRSHVLRSIEAAFND
jgi:hypothetical protein